VAKVEVSRIAVEDLDRLIASHGLPADTGARVRRSLTALESFPRIGRELEGRWRGFRFVIGPWPWLLAVYAYAPERDAVTVVGFHDARASSAATAARGR
jgi:hypothetical protein